MPLVPEKLLLEFGEKNKIRAEFVLMEGPSTTASRNCDEILAKWDTLWPPVKALILKMLVDYDRPGEIPEKGVFLSITIPGEAISSGPEWSIGLEFESGDGVWDAAFKGWEISEEDSQPIF